MEDSLDDEFADTSEDIIGAGSNHSTTDKFNGEETSSNLPAAELPISSSYESGLVSVSTSVVENLNALTLERDVAEETKDLFITVDNPEKHNSAFESYITFRVTTKTTRGEYDNSEYTVRRRYNDFIWLRNRLEHSHPAHLVPPLPEKHRSRLDRYSIAFLKVRMFALNKFLNRVADHPLLSNNKSFKIFVTANLPEFQSCKKTSGGSLLMKSFSESVHNMATSYMMKERAEEFDNMQHYIVKFGEKMGVMERIGSRIHTEQQVYLGYLNSLAPVYTLWSSSEEKMSRPLQAISKAVEENQEALEKMVNDYDIKVALPVREYYLYSEAIKAVLKRRDVYQIEYELTVQELKRKKEEKELLNTSDQSYSFGAFLGKNPEDVRRDKQQKVDQQIVELTRQVDENSDLMTCANADLKADMERWQVTKKTDMKTALLTLADQQIAYYQQCLEAWQRALPAISPSQQDVT